MTSDEKVAMVKREIPWHIMLEFRLMGGILYFISVPKEDGSQSVLMFCFSDILDDVIYLCQQDLKDAQRNRKAF